MRRCGKEVRSHKWPVRQRRPIHLPHDESNFEKGPGLHGGIERRKEKLCDNEYGRYEANKRPNKCKMAMPIDLG
jgi:hypothetical protein